MMTTTDSSSSRNQIINSEEEDTLSILRVIQFVVPYLYLHDLESVFHSCKSLYKYSLSVDIYNYGVLHSKFVTWKRFHDKTDISHHIKSLYLYNVQSWIELNNILQVFIIDDNSTTSTTKTFGLSQLSIVYTGPSEHLQQQQQNDSSLSTEWMNSLGEVNQCRSSSLLRSLSFIANRLNKYHVRIFTHRLSDTLRSLHLSGVIDWAVEDLSSLLGGLHHLESLRIENFILSTLHLPLSLSNLRSLSVTDLLAYNKFELILHESRLNNDYSINGSSSSSSNLSSTDSLSTVQIPMSIRNRNQLQLQYADFSRTCISLESVQALLISQHSLRTLVLNSCRSMTRAVEFRSPSLRILSLAYCSRLRSIRLDCSDLQQLDLRQCLLLEHADFGSSCNLNQLKVKVALTKLDVNSIVAMFPFAQFEV